MIIKLHDEYDTGPEQEHDSSDGNKKWEEKGEKDTCFKPVDAPLCTYIFSPDASVKPGIKNGSHDRHENKQ
jgi:hypothetical protein